MKNLNDGAKFMIGAGLLFIIIILLQSCATPEQLIYKEMLKQERYRTQAVKDSISYTAELKRIAADTLPRPIYNNYNNYQQPYLQPYIQRSIYPQFIDYGGTFLNGFYGGYYNTRPVIIRKRAPRQKQYRYNNTRTRTKSNRPRNKVRYNKPQNRVRTQSNTRRRISTSGRSRVNNKSRKQ